MPAPMNSWARSGFDVVDGAEKPRPAQAVGGGLEHLDLHQLTGSVTAIVTTMTERPPRKSSTTRAISSVKFVPSGSDV